MRELNDILGYKNLKIYQDTDYFSTVEKCVYKIYQDDSIPYLSDEFKRNNGLENE